MTGIADLSEHVRTTVEVERGVVAERLSSLREQSERLRALLEQVDIDLEEHARLLRRIDEMLGQADQLPLDLDGDLRGQKLREFAIEVLREQRSVGEPVHYREWYELVVADGRRVAGKDPVAAFLTQISRAPEVESVRPRSGLYRLRAV